MGLDRATQAWLLSLVELVCYEVVAINIYLLATFKTILTTSDASKSSSDGLPGQIHAIVMVFSGADRALVARQRCVGVRVVVPPVPPLRLGRRPTGYYFFGPCSRHPAISTVCTCACANARSSFARGEVESRSESCFLIPLHGTMYFYRFLFL